MPSSGIHPQVQSRGVCSAVGSAKQISAKLATTKALAIQPARAERGALTKLSTAAPRNGNKPATNSPAIIRSSLLALLRRFRTGAAGSGVRGRVCCAGR